MPWNYNNPYLPNNPYQQQYNAMLPNQPQVNVQGPQMQVVRVNGRNGAQAFQIGPNSSALLLDESGTMVWLVTTDGASYKTVAPYDIAPHQDAPAPDFSGLESRIKRLEDFVNEYTGDSTTASTVKPDTSKSTDNSANAGYGTYRK